MQVRVLFFGVLKDLAGRSSDVLSLPDQALARDVLTHYEQRLSTAKGMLGSIAISVPTSGRLAGTPKCHCAV